MKLFNVLLFAFVVSWKTSWLHKDSEEHETRLESVTFETRKEAEEFKKHHVPSGAWHIIIKEKHSGRKVD